MGFLFKFGSAPHKDFVGYKFEVYQPPKPQINTPASSTKNISNVNPGFLSTFRSVLRAFHEGVTQWSTKISEKLSSFWKKSAPQETATTVKVTTPPIPKNVYRREHMKNVFGSEYNHEKIKRQSLEGQNSTQNNLPIQGAFYTQATAAKEPNVKSRPGINCFI